MNMILRLIWVYFRARFRPRFGVLVAYEVTLRALPLDLDVCLHMNNGRYLSIMDLGRVDMMLRSGLWAAIRKAGLTVTVAAETIGFTRSLLPFQRFTLETRILGWDERAIYMQQRFLRRRKGLVPEVAAEGIVRVRLLAANGGSVSTQFMSDLGKQPLESPPLPEWVKDWVRNLREAAGQTPPAGAIELYADSEGSDAGWHATPPS